MFKQMDTSNLETHEDMKKAFDISEDKNQVDDMNQKMFAFMYARLKEKQIEFYAFLNKEFNILNFKSSKCALHCFDDVNQSTRKVKECI